MPPEMLNGNRSGAPAMMRLARRGDAMRRRITLRSEHPREPEAGGRKRGANGGGARSEVS